MPADPFWGQSPEELTVSASPAPTNTVFTVSSAANLDDDLWILVRVDGVYEDARILSISGNQLTLHSALSGVPDVPGSVLDLRELISARRLAKSGIFYAASPAELMGVDTRYAPNGVQYYVEGVGIYRLETDSADAADGLLILAPDLGPGRWRLKIQALIRVTHLEKIALTAFDGMLVYNTTHGTLEVSKAGRWHAAALTRSDYDLSGTVTNIVSGAPLAGVVVTANGDQTDTTAADGTYLIANVPKGAAVSITGSLASYNGYASTVDLSSGNATRNFTMGRRTVSGTVTSSAGGAISGATVEIASLGRSTTTNGSGEYALLDIPDGSYTVTASHANHVSYTSGTVAVSGNTTHDFQMTIQTGTVAGTVTSSVTGQPVSGASVTIGALPAVNTNASGQYSKSGVNWGSYSVNATKATYFQAYSDSVTVNASSVTKNFTMTPETVGFMTFGSLTWGTGSVNQLMEAIKINLTRTVQATGIRVWNGSALNNYDVQQVRIYNASNSLVGNSSGSNLISPGAELTISLSSPVTLSPGDYWIAVIRNVGGGFCKLSDSVGASAFSHHEAGTIYPNYWYSNVDTHPGSWLQSGTNQVLGLSVQIRL